MIDQDVPCLTKYMTRGNEQAISSKPAHVNTFEVSPTGLGVEETFGRNRIGTIEYGFPLLEKGCPQGPESDGPITPPRL